MNCHSCTNPAEFYCSCTTTLQCSNHIESHLQAPGLHSIESLEFTLTDLESSFKPKLLEAINKIQKLKHDTSLKCQEFIKTIQQLESKSTERLDSLLFHYSKMLTQTLFSSSQKSEIDKITKTNSVVKNLCAEIRRERNKALSGILAVDKNDMTVKEKLDYIKSVGYKLPSDVDSVNMCEVRISNDEEMAFLCKKYEGVFR